MENNNGQIEINILDLLRLCLRYWWTIVICAVIGTAGGFAVSYLTTTQTYKAEALLYVNNTNSLGSIKEELESLSISDINASKSLVDVYCIIIETRTTLDEVSKRLNNIQTYYPEVTYTPVMFGHSDFGSANGFKYDYDYLINMVDVSAVNDTEVFKIQITSENSNECVFIANVIADVATENISSIINGTSVKVVDDAQISEAISRGLAKSMLIGCLIGIVVACGIIFIIYITNDVIETDDWVKTAFNGEIPVLSIIPDSLEPEKSRYDKYYYKYSGYYYRKSNNDGNN